MYWIPFFLQDFSVSQWKSDKMVTSMNNYSIAVLEEELELFGYLYPENQTCDKASDFSSSPGWINSKKLIRMSDDIAIFLIEY